MLSSPDLSFSRNLPFVVFNQLGELLQQMAQVVGTAALVLTEAVLARINTPLEWQSQKFTLVISEQFSALLLGQEEQEKQGNYTGFNASLTFNSEAIAFFVSQVRDLFAGDSYIHQNLERYRQTLKPNDGEIQTQFTLLLLEYLLPQANEETRATFSTKEAKAYSCQAVEDALKNRVQREQLLNQVTTQIRKSLELPVIMATTIALVREFLQLDRLVIYKFEDSKVNNQQVTTVNGQKPPSVGSIVHEARSQNSISSLLYYQEEACFVKNSPCWQKYRQGFTLVVDDVEKTYALEECLLNFLRKNQVRAKLVAPIMFEQNLWGLVIAHQCYTPREWTENEKSLLTSIAEQLAIAIHQSQLMESLQDATRTLTQEKRSLEHLVISRTMALREALLAAEAASRLRNEFLATISHELLTPLTYVIGMSSTLLRWPLGELTQRQRDYLQKIHDSGEHLLGLINDILDLSQIEAGKTVLDITEFSLTDTAHSSVDSLLKKAASEQVNLQLDLQIDPRRDLFTADAERVEQILWNLLTNAIKFTPEGGTVTLRVWVEDNTAIFQVEDTGIGIPQEKLPLLFEKFQQLDTPYHRRYEGSGLGLALTKQLVELHRGRIEVESTVAIGSIFTVWIPAQLSGSGK
ncbi:GAF domain-containing sensor histidine kinase [Umezakia ovalisporum]|jgi:two-component system sensor histidine kinase/response regulator|uniref:histidine kinase n=2 Tax=Umezakia ovalisporum TaxID=75695 RepID=A0AA43GYJ7_9CYAN|nr:GAF domain-containing sensor histidine kinase [Umezakia ovalisporum]MDH6057348.1 GAF domain-containing sensor histidine kinase [Umezakia ovalisporum FSS-43]MDH6063587.1 GAF domain-containing sensor histidine kinase [Umezakia ovalisporum FSS-62]MDH6065966.1 GAF domain-containing sensor histidine kinase [Umezakia ovalisporum APH033B]MDH6072512.1 GAF domain-containing sensor histidine kinase [Umezakia ovalisporum CobakiLakeA]MDH6075577.1 GAF domain-containing sensor histidine kinase [Umezakia 